MNKYHVRSLHVPEEGEPFEVTELVRTDPKVAQNDASIVRDILHRKSWVEEAK
jgi:hypothetical protein